MLHKLFAIMRLLVARSRLEHLFVAGVAGCNALHMHEVEAFVNGGLTVFALVVIVLEIREGA